ncbi:MAG: biotin synthase BioB [Deltaproteobacteria bacterium]|nr:biotin synthase BioB [Deltaproteobacteria bacterium]
MKDTTEKKTDFDLLAHRVLSGGTITRGEAAAVLRSDDDELLAVLQAAFRVRVRHFGRRVRLHVIENAKSGMCSENCRYCGQSADASGVPVYPLKSVDEILADAHEASQAGAYRYCIVTSGRAPSTAELARLCEALRRIRAELPIHTCASLGLLTAAQAHELKNAGLDRYNHNLETSARFFPTTCTAHTYADRLATTRVVKEAGLELCSGGLFGMGETVDDRVALAFALKEAGSDAVPVNFLNPRPTTVLAEQPRLKPAECLRILAMLRLVLPDREVRVAGGREVCLGAMQPLALFAADSIFTRGYLTTPGQGIAQDRTMITEAGFILAGIDH